MLDSRETGQQESKMSETMFKVIIIGDPTGKIFYFARNKFLVSQKFMSLLLRNKCRFIMNFNSREDVLCSALYSGHFQERLQGYSWRRFCPESFQMVRKSDNTFAIVGYCWYFNTKLYWKKPLEALH